MSDQHAAAALTAAAAIALVRITRAAVLRSGFQHITRARPRRRWGRLPAGPSAPRDDSADSAVRDAEQHVRHCWQHLQTHTDPPE